MIFARRITYGLDEKIYLLQRELEASLPYLSANGGSLTSAQLHIYGQIYKLSQVGGEDRPERWHKDNEYQDILNSDLTYGQIAFNVTDRRLSDATIDIIFCLNLAKLYDNSLYEDERAFLEAHKVLIDSAYISGVTGFKKGVANVLSGFNTEEREYSDMSPMVIFAYTIETPFAWDSCKTRALRSPEDGTLITADSITITADDNTITVDQLRI